MYHPGETTEDGSENGNREKGGLLPAGNDETDGLLQDKGKVRFGGRRYTTSSLRKGAKGERVDEVEPLSVQDKTYFTLPSDFITREQLSFLKSSYGMRCYIRIDLKIDHNVHNSTFDSTEEIESRFSIYYTDCLIKSFHLIRKVVYKKMTIQNDKINYVHYFIDGNVEYISQCYCYILFL